MCGVSAPLLHLKFLDKEKSFDSFKSDIIFFTVHMITALLSYASNPLQAK